MSPRPSPASLETLRRDGEEFMQDLHREQYLAWAGHKASADLQGVFAKHPAVTHDDALHMAREAFQSAAEGSEEKRAARMLLEWQVDMMVGRELAPLDERTIAWEASAILRMEDGQEIEFERAWVEIGNSGDRARRMAIDDARNGIVGRELAPIRRERLWRERELTENLGIADGFNSTFELLSGIRLSTLIEQCEALIRDTQALYDDAFREVIRREIGIDPRDAQRSDAVVVFRGHRFDEYFPPREMQDRVMRQSREMGIDPLAAGRIIVDVEDRPGKKSRAFCAPVRVPDEVYLVLRPQGGQRDWRTFLHELGHAVHYAHIRPELPFEYRWLGDPTITEGFAMLFDNVLKDGGWLKRYTDLGPANVQSYLRATAFEELHLLRRYCAKFVYETELLGGSTSWDDMPDAFVERLTTATSFRYHPANAFVDVDPRFYASRYLRAWQLQALLTEKLVAEYDSDWWRNPRAGPWLRDELLAEGQREEGSAFAERVTGRQLSFGPMIRSLERLLT